MIPRGVSEGLRLPLAFSPWAFSRSAVKGSQIHCIDFHLEDSNTHCDALCHRTDIQHRNPFHSTHPALNGNMDIKRRQQQYRHRPSSL